MLDFGCGCTGANATDGAGLRDMIDQAALRWHRRQGTSTVRSSLACVQGLLFWQWGRVSPGHRSGSAEDGSERT